VSADVIRTVRRFGRYYDRAEPFRETDPLGWECRVKVGETIKAALRTRGRVGKVVQMRRKAR
jgi:hypothetical protein